MSERLISADSHVKMTHDQVKSHLSPKFHDDYDEASGAYEARMSRGTGAANRAGAAKVAASHSVFSRPGYWDPVERLKDMDADGVEKEVLYSEVSAFRYLSDVKSGIGETVRRWTADCGRGRVIRIISGSSVSGFRWRCSVWPSRRRTPGGCAWAHSGCWACSSAAASR